MMGLKRSIFLFIAVGVLSQVLGEVKSGAQFHYGKVDNLLLYNFMIDILLSIEREYEVIIEHICLIDIILRSHAEGEQRGILVDVDDPILPSDDTSSLQETPSLSGVFSLFAEGILNTVLTLITTVFGFGIDSLKSVMLGRTTDNILSEVATRIVLA